MYSSQRVAAAADARMRFATQRRSLRVCGGGGGGGGGGACAAAEPADRAGQQQQQREVRAQSSGCWPLTSTRHTAPANRPRKAQGDGLADIQIHVPCTQIVRRSWECDRAERWNNDNQNFVSKISKLCETFNIFTKFLVL
jgi:hypothetical protein